jgi:hypothetical protein
VTGPIVTTLATMLWLVAVLAPLSTDSSASSCFWFRRFMRDQDRAHEWF